MAVLRRPLPRLTRCGLSVCTFNPFPVSIKSKGPFCRGESVREFGVASPLPPQKAPRTQPGAGLLLSCNRTRREATYWSLWIYLKFWLDCPLCLLRQKQGERKGSSTLHVGRLSLWQGSPSTAGCGPQT